MKLQNVETNRKLMAKLISSGGAFKSSGEDLVREFSSTEAAVRGLIDRFEKEKIVRLIGGRGFSEERLFVLTDDLEILSNNKHLVEQKKAPTPPPPSLESLAKQYLSERFAHEGLNREVAVCILKDFVKWGG